MRRAFTLIELLVVIAIIAILAAILFPVFAQAKATAKKTACLSNLKQVGLAMELYKQDFDGAYPQSKGTTSSQPQIDDADGSIEEPDTGSVFTMILPFTGGGNNVTDLAMTRQRLYACPSDPNPNDPQCPTVINPGGPTVNSYLINAYFVFGMNESQVESTAGTIYLGERRSETVDGQVPYCDDVYHPWFNPNNPVAPGNEMDPRVGAISTLRHGQGSNWVYADSHAGWKVFNQTFNLSGLNRHDPFAKS